MFSISTRKGSRLFLAAILVAIPLAAGHVTAAPAAAIDICSSSHCADVVLQFYGAGTAHAVDDAGQIDCTWNGSSTSGTCSTTYVWAYLFPSLDVTVTVTPSSTSFVCYADCKELGQPFVQPLTLTPGNGATLTYGVEPARRATVHVHASGDGAGHVSSSPTGMDCRFAAGATSGVCDHTWLFANAITVTLVSLPDSQTGTCWQGPTYCTPIGGANSWPIAATVSIETTVNVFFNKGHPIVTVGIQGKGKVSSSPTGISCPSTCSRYFLPGTALALTAIPAKGYVFERWSGSCSGSGSVCQLSLGTADRSTTAVFGLAATPSPTADPTAPPRASARPPAQSQGPTVSNPSVTPTEPTAGASLDAGAATAAPSDSPAPVAAVGPTIPSQTDGAARQVAVPSGAPADLSSLIAWAAALIVIVLLLAAAIGFAAGRRRKETSG